MFFCDTDLIKVIAGVRRCGKSSLLDLIGIAIESKGVAGRGSLSVSLENNGTGYGEAGHRSCRATAPLVPLKSSAPA